MKKFISFTYTAKEKYEKAIKELKEGDYIEIYSSHGIHYGKIEKINPDRISLKSNISTRHMLWESIDSITLVNK